MTVGTSRTTGDGWTRLRYQRVLVRPPAPGCASDNDGASSAHRGTSLRGERPATPAATSEGHDRPKRRRDVYVSGNQNLWQCQDAGGTWRNIGAFPGAWRPRRGADQPQQCGVATGTQVWVTTNALAATVGAPNGVMFTNITRNLPTRNVLRVAFDPIDPTVIYAVLGGFNGAPGQRGHVFRTTVGGTTWTDISPDLDVPFGALALDGADTPTTIYVGTDLGVLRSVDDGAQLDGAR